jgi:putative endonuclease
LGGISRNDPSVLGVHHGEPQRHAYIGITNDLQVRVQQHRAGEIEGFSSKYRCTRLVYFESFDNVLKAISREKQLKGWRRSKKIALIEEANPRWQDLAEKWGAKLRFAGEALS